ncbi:hypothetical protein NBRC116601_35230 [Cognatishimia sp. WU-CL00825]|uniref:TRAP transporter small permease n=1 Tax=Cognatishimia sp. WU-CL00825 TaxID=3127658 RepID=UPI003106D359
MAGHTLEKLPLSALMRTLGTIACVIGSLGIFFMMILTVVSVFWRYVLNDALFGVEDLQVLAAAVVVACAIFYGGLYGAHVTIELIERHLPQRFLRATDVVVHALCAGILALAVRALIKKGGCGFDCGAITVNLGIVHTPFYYILAVACGLMAIFYVLRLIEGLQTKGTG